MAALASFTRSRKDIKTNSVCHQFNLFQIYSLVHSGSTPTARKLGRDLFTTAALLQENCLMVGRSATQLHPPSKNSTANSKQRLPTSKYDILRDSKYDPEMTGLSASANAHLYKVQESGHYLTLINSHFNTHGFYATQVYT